MPHNGIGEGRKKLWLLLAMSAALAHNAGVGYMAMILALGAILPLDLLCRDGFSGLGKGWSFVQWVWILLVLAHMVPASGSYWPGEKARLAVPVVLLTLAAFSGDVCQRAKAASVLFRLSGPLLVILLGAGVGAGRLGWLEPTRGEWTADLVITLLLPAAISALEPIRRGRTALIGTVGVMGVAFSVILQGVLGPAAAADAAAPVFELGRTVRNGGMELLAAVSMTLGWYGFSSLLVSMGEKFATRLPMGEKPARILTAGIPAAMILPGLRIPDQVLAWGSVILWVVVPMVARKNNSEKMKKSVDK